MSDETKLVDAGDNWSVRALAPPSEFTRNHDAWLAADLIGGTLVEYLDSAGFSREWGRATITLIDKTDNTIEFVTGGEAHLWHTLSNTADVEIEGGVFYVRIPYLYCYAMAPEGVEIPTPMERTRLARLRSQEGTADA